MREYDCAFLVYAPLRQRRADNSFDGNDNIGAKVIADALTRAGLRVGYVTPESAHTVPLVLISLTSTYDIYALLECVALRADWQPGARAFKVLAGGFGMQNPIAIRKYIDYAAFGRAHEWVESVVRAILAGAEPEHESVMDMRRMNPVKISQGELYPHEVDGFKEEFTGCPLKCKFCHYTFARKHQGTDDSYSYDHGGVYAQSMLTGGSTPEVTWPQLLTWPKKAGRVRVAIDGFSERLRYMYGKRISNADIVAGLNNMGSYGPNATVLLVYNIVNFPGETDADYQEFVDTVSQADPAYRMVMVIHSTPFRPSLATPMQWEGVSLTPDWSKRRAKVIIDKPNLRVVHSFTLETPWSHLRSIVVERATPDDDAAIHAITFSPKLAAANHGEALRMFKRNWSPEKWLAERDIDGPSPAPYLSGYLPDATLRKMARKMRQQRAAGIVPGRKLKTITITETRD
jgi:radical SAM superfamily enzyme YgiQ (UPF0313 family)